MSLNREISHPQLGSIPPRTTSKAKSLLVITGSFAFSGIGLGRLAGLKGFAELPSIRLAQARTWNTLWQLRILQMDWAEYF